MDDDASRTLTQRLAEHVWKGDLEAHVRQRRAEGMPWRAIAREVWDVTKGVIDLTDQTLRKWYPDVVADPAPARRKRGAA